MAFRPYTVAEVRDAALAFGVDPDFAEAIYARESSRGANANALTVRKVERKKSGPTFVRGPFQLEDDTTMGIIRNNKLPIANINVNDPDTHLQLAMQLMRELQDRRNGDIHKMAQDYLGPGGSDELGSTPQSYADQVVTEYRKLKGESGTAPSGGVYAGLPAAPVGTPMFPELGTTGGEAIPADDLFGIPPMPAMPTLPKMPNMASIPRDPLGLPMYITAATQPHPQDGPNTDFDVWIQKLVDEELQGRSYASAGG
jgi:hypothetical protein